jgi:hypothetical protein
MEIIWIATGALCVVACIRLAINNGGSKTFLFALMALICFVFAWLRDKQRKKS